MSIVTFEKVEEQSDSSSNSSSNCRDVRTVSRLCDAMSVPSSDYLECFSSGDDTESETDDEERDPTLVRRIVEHPYMEVGVALLIFANCITLALDSPGGDESPVLNGFEYFFTVAFFIEAVLKMMAKGVIHPRRAYLRSNWNKFDFLIIVINVICLVTNVGKNVSSIRTLRVLKALLMVDRTPGLKQMVVATIKSLKSLAHLALLILFIVVIHSIWAVQMWKGTWRYRCVNAEGLLDHTGGCSPNMTSTVSLVMSHECSDGYKCLPVGNPSYGLASFDNFGASVVLIVQCITLSGWSQIMVHTIDANGDFPIFFFGGIVSISNYIVLPLSIIIVKNALHRINTHRPLSQKRTAFRLMRSSLHSAPPTTPSRLSKQVFLEGRKQHKFLIILSFVVPPLLVINVLLMAMVHYKMDRRWEQAIHAFGTAASAFFFLEVVTKFMLLRRSYFSDYFNIFDLILVLLSVISRTVFSGDGSVVIALRVLRLVRVIRLLKSTSVRRQIEGIIGATKKTGYMLLLVLIYTFMVALFLMHMYGSATEAFSSFNKSILASLQVITGDKWGSVMYAVMNDHTPAAAVMFIVFHFLGHFLTTKLFVAVVMEYYEFVQEALATCGTSGRRRRADSRMKKSIKTVERLNHRDQTQRDELVLHIQLAVPHDYRHTPELCDAYMKGVLEASYENHSMVELYMKNEVRGKKLVEAFTRGRGTRESVSRDKLSVLLGWSATLAALTAVQPHEDLDNDENSMFIFPPSVRQHVAWVVKRPWFDRIAIILALLSCITSALGSFYEHEIMVVDYYITGFFFVEMLLKSVAYGFIKGEGAYLKNGWNQFDFMILLVVLLSYVLAPLHISVVKVIRSLRAIRPMRLLKRWKGVKLVALALVRCLPGLLSAFALVSLVLILFAVWGVNIMKGRFGQCTVPYIGAMTDCHGEYFYPDNFTDYTFPEELVINTTEGGFIVTAEWVSRAQHFDHVFAAVRSLLALSTYDNWRAHLELYQSVCFEKSPGQCDPSAAPVVFLLLFLAWNVFFVYPIVTAEVVVIYIEVRKEIEHTADYSVRELAYFYMMKMLFLIKPSYKNSPRDSQLARYCYFVVTHRWFDNIIGVTIVLNIITMATEHEGMPDVLGKMLLVTDTGFTFLFLIEAVLKLSAFGTAYFKESWNRFDFLLVTASMIEFIVFVVMGSNSLPVNPFILRSLRAFLRLRKAQRLLRLVKRTRGIQLLFETLWVALPYLCANAFFYFMTTLVYSIVGVGLFNSVKWTPNGLDTHVNFNNVLSASITLHRVATGDNWAVLMENCMLSPPYCSEEGDTCGYPFAAPVYFITFKGLSYIVIVTLFIATVVDHYTAMTKLGGLTGGMREISILHSVWSEMFSNKETIPAMCLPPLMVEIGKRKSVDYTPKFFLPENYTRLDFFKIFESYQIIDHQGVVHFSSLLLEVAFNQLSKVNGKGITRKEWWSFEYDWYRLVPAIRLPVSRLLWYRYRLRDYFAVVFIQRWYRFLLRLSKMRRLLPLDVAYWKSKRAQPRLERGNTFTKARYRSPTELEKVHEKSLTFPDNVSSVSSYVLSAPTATLATPLLADFAPQFSQLSNPLLSTSHKSGPSSVLL